MHARALVAMACCAAIGLAEATVDDVTLGEQLFHHTWTPDDPVAGGDGLGPLYNATSCVACHSQGGAGGGGGRLLNVQQLIVPNNSTMVVHREGVSETFGAWRQSKLVLPRVRSRRHNGPTIVERNTPALFGAGLIDAIPDGVIRHNIATTPKEVRGRVITNESGRVNRFGWKGDIDSLESFVVQACAMEIGLSSASQQAPPDPTVSADPNARPDLSSKQIRGLVAYISALPSPREAEHPGKQVFVDAGCESCHTQTLGDAKGLYSDLALHDLGSQLASSGGAYGGGGRRLLTANEWRTPPLWGVGSSAPYLHDGRAETLYEAIRAHGGQAKHASAAFVLLSSEKQALLQEFLMSLEAPNAS